MVLFTSQAATIVRSLQKQEITSQSAATETEQLCECVLDSNAYDLPSKLPASFLLSNLPAASYEFMSLNDAHICTYKYKYYTYTVHTQRKREGTS